MKKEEPEEPEEPMFEPEVNLTKEIDYLGDDVANAHTDLSTGEDYRLYLSVENSTDKPAKEVKPLDKVTIADKLSPHVVFNAAQPDFVVERKLNGVTTVVPESEYKITRNRQDVSLEMLNPQPLNSVVTLSFNIKVNKKQTMDYLINNDFNYPKNGDLATDYLSNATSSSKPGFHSNTENAKATWSIDGQTTTNSFSHPVIQADLDPSAKGRVTRSMRRLGKKRANFDTNVDDDNYYRVYAELHGSTDGKIDEEVPLIKSVYKDQMSKYMSLREANLDLKVIMTNDKGVTKEVATEDYDATYTRTNLEVDIHQTIPNNGKVTVSYNLRISAGNVLNDWLENGLNYPDIGDPDTDYDGEPISSNQPGFAISKKIDFYLDRKNNRS